MTTDVRYRVYVDWDNDGSFATSGDDITAYVTSLSGIAGMEDDLKHVASVGMCTIYLRNVDRRFSPENSAGPLYGKLLPLRPLKIEVTDGTTTWPLFRGRIRELRAQSGATGPREAVIEAEDLLAALRDYDLSMPLLEDVTADDLLERIGSSAFATARATGYIAFNGNPANNDTVTVDGITYTFKSALTTPAVANEVLIGADAEETGANLIAAMMGEEGAGTTYSTGTERCERVTALADGETLSIPTAGVAQGFAVGRWPDNGYLYYTGQSFTLAIGGILDVLSLWFGFRGGSPVGTMTWKIFDFDPDTGQTVGAALETGTFTPATPEPIWNTVTPAGTTYLEPGVYKLELEPTVDQASGDYWNVLASDGAAGDVYEDGTFWQLQADPLDDWGEWVGQDLTMTLTCAFQRILLTAVMPGAWGNSIALSKSSANLGVSGANLSGGVNGPVGLMDYEAGTQTFEIAGDLWQADTTNALGAISDAVLSEWGYFWAARDGTLTFRNKDWVFKRQLAAAAVTIDGEPNAADGNVSLDRVYNQAIVNYSPYRRLDLGVVARMNQPLKIPGKRQRKRRNTYDDKPYTGETVKLQYVDPDTGQLMGATDLVHPVPGTDYRVTRGEPGLGEDVSGNNAIGCTLARNGADIEVTFQNTALLTYWVQDFQVRGVGIARYERDQITVDDADSIAAYGRRATPPADILLPSSRTLAESVAGYLLVRHKAPLYRVPEIRFRTQTVIGGTNVFSVEIGDVVEASDDQTGLDAVRYLVIGHRFSMRPGGETDLSWFVRRLDDRNFFILDDPVYSKLDGTNYLTI